MRQIGEKRKAVEAERHEHIVSRGWRKFVHLENMPWLLKAFKWCMFKTPLGPWGHRNALKISTERIEFAFDDLPDAFDGLRLLLLTDFHIDEFPDLAQRTVAITETLEYDYCILGGDYNFGYRQESGLAFLRMKEVVEKLVTRSRVFAILGNHDRYRMAENLSDAGAEVLINENVCLEKDGQKIYLAGLDDCHYYEADDIDLAQEGIPDDGFKILISHSPEKFRQAAEAGYRLYLAGHVHGGQICLPGGIPIVTYATVKRHILKGRWTWENLSGYTSRGVGASGIPVRFFCPPEITVITLKRTPG